MAGQIDPADYEKWETLILSGQVAEDVLRRLLRENPDFARWLKARAQGRHTKGDDK